MGERRPTVIFAMDHSHLILTNRNTLTKHRVSLMNGPVRSEPLNRINSLLERFVPLPTEHTVVSNLFLSRRSLGGK